MLCHCNCQTLQHIKQPKHSSKPQPLPRPCRPSPREVQQLVLGDRQRLARGDAQHVLHQVLACDGLGDGVLNLVGEGGEG